MQSVKGYIERHYTAIGMAWPPVRPTRDDTHAPEDDENGGSRYRRRPEKKRHGYHDNGVVGGGVYRPACSLSSISQAAAILAGAHAYDQSQGAANGAWRPPNGGSKYGSTEAGNALSLLAEVIAGGRVDRGGMGSRVHHHPPQSSGRGSTSAAASGGRTEDDGEVASLVANPPRDTSLEESSICPGAQPRDVRASSQKQTPEEREKDKDTASVGDTAELIESNPAPQADPVVSPLHSEKTDDVLLFPSPTIARALPCPAPAPVVTVTRQSERVEKTATGAESDGRMVASEAPDTIAASPICNSP